MPEFIVTSPSCQFQKYNGASIASVTTLSVSGDTDSIAPVPQVLVHAVISACVAISTLPATVVLAFGVTVPVSTDSRCAVVVL